MTYYTYRIVSGLLLLESLIIRLPAIVHGSVVSTTKDVFLEDHQDAKASETFQSIRRDRRVGRIRYHFEDNNYNQTDSAEKIDLDTGTSTFFSIKSTLYPCSHVVVIGVGTSMTVEDYDILARKIVNGTSIVVIVTNHNVNGILKSSARRYACLINAVYDQLEELVPICSLQSITTAGTITSATTTSTTTTTTSKKEKNFIVGGHSSSGQAAFDASQKYLFDFQPLAFFGLDPYPVTPSNEELRLQIPALFWGLRTTTCFVHVQTAAMGAYQLSLSDSGRVLYAIDNTHNEITHCVFTDHGCGIGPIIVCPTERTTFGWVYDAVANSLHAYLHALETKQEFQRDMFELTQTKVGDVMLLVNEDASVAKPGQLPKDASYLNFD
jgi:hypothetical protein